jgi:glycosyltransferase involved in cell wall biosynthesis
MRVLYFSDNGSDHNRRFLEKIGSFGHEVFFLDSTGQEPRFVLPPGVLRVKPRQTFPRDVAPHTVEAFLPELQSWLRELRPDILHAGPVQSCGYLAALSGFHPLVVMSWGSDLMLHAEKDAVWRHATEVALRGADGFACDCDAVRSAGLRYATFSPDRIAQFPWGMKRGVFSPLGEKPSAWRPATGAVTFLCTRSWEPLYDMDVLLNAFVEAYARNQNLRLLLLGDGSLRPYILQFISHQKLAEVVTVRGEIQPSEMPQWFRTADVYVSCAKSDGTSISLLEAMATALPVVVSDIPSNREWIQQGENGWLASVGSSPDFADKLLLAASLSPGEASAMGERNQQIIAQRADWDRNFPLLMNLYERVVASPRDICASGKGPSL